MKSSPRSPASSLWLFLYLVGASALIPISGVSAQSLANNLESTPIPQPLMTYPNLNDADLWLYKPGEIFIEGFAVASTNKGSTIGSSLGEGGAIGWYFSRNFAVKAEAWTANLQNGHATSLLGGMEARLPIDSAAIAFYAFAEGGGFLADVNGGTFQAGLGIDMRLTERVSLIFDVRGILAGHQKTTHPDQNISGVHGNTDTPNGAALFRLGLRFSF